MISWLFKAFLTLCLAAALLASIVFYYAYKGFHAPLPLKNPIIFEIKNGQSLRGVASDLTHIEILNTPYSFHIGLYILGMNSSIKAGEYRLETGMSTHDVLNLFQNGSNYHRLITIHEGLTSYEIVQILNQNNALSGTIKDIPAEGSLLPETYSYERNENRNTVIKRMQNTLKTTLDQAWEDRIEDLPLKNKEEALVLASIIEKETAVATERRMVSGVFINRLRKGMPLQTDPTVIYSITNGKHDNNRKGPLGRRLLRKDLKTDSPYNTYLYPGLPPGPIANAGAASIQAALTPESHDYIYFVADGTGGHAFAKTLADHNTNVSQWRKIRRQQSMTAP